MLRFQIGTIKNQFKAYSNIEGLIMNLRFTTNNNNVSTIIESKITIYGRSIRKILKYVDHLYLQESRAREETMNTLSHATKEYEDCICFIEESKDWKAYILRKNHTDKVVIHLRLLSNYFRNLENFIDAFLLKKLKINRNQLSVQIDQLLPDRDFTPVFISKSVWKRFLLSVIFTGITISLSYWKFIEVDKKAGTDLLLLVAAGNSYAVFDVIKNLLENRNKPWIKS